MKKKVAVLLILAFLCLLGVQELLVFGNVAPKKDLHDLLLRPPNIVWQTYGYGEDTFRLYNMSEVLKACIANRQRIEVLEKQVAKLKEQIVELEGIVGKYPPELDPNDYENTIIGAILGHTSAINQFRAQIDTNTSNIKIMLDPNEVKK